MLYADEDSAVFDLSTKIKDAQVQNLRIIYTAMAMGVFSFFTVCVILFFKNKEVYEQVSEMMALNFVPLQLLFIFSIVIYSLLLFNPGILFNKVFNDNKTKLLNDNRELNIDNAISIIRTLIIIKLGMFESAAFFGLVVLLYSILQLEIFPAPVFWTAAIPAMIMIVYILITFPKKETIARDIYRRGIIRLDNQQIQ